MNGEAVDSEALVKLLLGLADEWVAAERDADEYGPRHAYTGYDCAEMLRDALRLGGAK